MLSRSLRTVVPLTAAVLFSAALSGCWNPFKPENKKKDPEPVEILDRTSKVNLIKFFAKAHEDRNGDNYALALHDQYQFWFSEDDRSAPNWDWKDWIGRGEDVEITRRMFDAQEIIDIRVDFLNQTAVAPGADPEDNFWEAPQVDGENEFLVYWADFHVDMHVTEETSEDRIDHWVDGRAYIYLIPDPNYEGEWQIWKIEDKGNEHKKGGESTSWGNLKRMMR
jgi:hypothetical protein